jgi:cytoskeletal protein CcmA (bactofilin family)
VTGSIRASGRLEILSTGKVWGNVDVGSFLLDEDGYFRGSLAMKDEPEPPDFSSISFEEDVLPEPVPEIDPQLVEEKPEG